MGQQYASLTVQQARRVGAAVQAFEAEGRNRGKNAVHIRGGNAKFRAKITAVSGSFPQWSYTVQRIIGYNSSLSGTAKWLTDGRNLTGVLNTCEITGTPSYTYGNGLTITSSSGQANSTACVVVAIGVGAVVDVETNCDRNGDAAVRSFFASNQAQ